ncbi:MAG: nucleotidyltransferase family protein [Winogradskyella sp.]|uniref:nucleotidyltransferase family protein n=1 Tax=Winogradskyella sp. TaxID=1883156 RepID=UPI0026008711|nr:nucleotidyltransferase family protein [Winogradskyella sp.]NRB60118.1 nucleotidyltransferase family protein [Winogradskyella sp.]
MAKRIATYQHIADILSFESSTEALEAALTAPDFDWDAIVMEGSKHLVLPALYCRLKSKGLLTVLPEELSTYLEEITNINRNRNKVILEQVHWLSTVFNTHHINHVFLKGAAVLAMDLYDDMAERMIGDIDVLVDLEQLDTAYELLIKNNYTPIPQTLGHDFFEHKHLPRLKTKDFICAVEIHRKLFVSNENVTLTNTNLINNKEKVNDIFVPNHQHLIMHNVLNHQLNDDGYYFSTVNFRSSHESIRLLQIEPIKHEQYNDTFIQSYFNLIGIFFKDEVLHLYATKNLRITFALQRLKYPTLNHLYFKILKWWRFIHIIINRSILFVKNSSYRKAILKDRRRISAHLLSFIKNS